ncbi:polyphosphate kinase 1 [Plebeiibacterium sediminum]|uniref:Polyphosphate kinase n=1 Tax=Plebeiibacterium sediminum TaxID=2992112 RepID=A0AAE3SDX9_9BACT|nr:polyphosphate kinase 1 [Plebeiobacterium sediminum]MCW3785387.1 polyphosphate kinase 1 [Plebeiobacterium sediminum]
MTIENFRSKEISWLSFNDRVLQEASRKNVPLIERIKFLGIYSNNMDEFFRVRVAVLKRIVQLDKNTVFEGGAPKDILKDIHNEVIRQSRKFAKTYDDIIEGLQEEGIYLINETDLTEDQGNFVKKYFQKKVRGNLMPIIISKKRELPDLSDNGIYLGVYLQELLNGKDHYALIEIPSSLDRFVLLPSNDGKKYVMLLDDVIRYELKDIFYMFKFDRISAFTFKLTRDAELDINDDISESYVKKISKGLERRKEASPVRFVHDKNMPDEMLSLLLKKLDYTTEDAVIRGGRYHNFKDFIDFPKFGAKNLTYDSLPTIYHKQIQPQTSLFKIITKRDVLLHYPYHSFSHFIDFLREASIDPYVRDIKITIYRVAKNSAVMKALRNAARNGKQVVAVMELQARFDEKANISYANKLKEAGVKVIFGVPGLKVHSKLCLVTRKEKSNLVCYAGVGTGNFNEDSANIFADHFLLTRHVGIAKEVSSVFEFFSKNYNIPTFEHLLVSPFILRGTIENYIRKEMEYASKGKKAYIYIKVNNLVDYDLIQLLYEAKKAGVEVILNVRGMFSLVSEFDKPENAIESFGLIDQFLEHSRILVFCNGGDEKVYISSADFMTRNLDRRIEVACPIYNKELKKEILTMLDMQRKDNCSSRILNNAMDNTLRGKKSDEPEFRAQLEFYKWLRDK